MLALAALIALLLDALVGWPERLYRFVGHPVGLFAAYLSWGAKRWNNLKSSFAQRRFAGAAVMLSLTALTVIACLGLEWAARSISGEFAIIATILLAWPAFAQRSLFQHGKAVADALELDGLIAGQRAVGRMCGRDVEALDQHGVSRAAIESIAESLSDGIVAPLFWMLVGGLPALWAYKAINTADSLIGHKDDQWRAFGWAAARLDDLANLIPARITAMMICLCAGRGWRIMWRDHRNHASPNSGWPEAAMAGALSLRLAGPVRYDAVWADKPWIGDGRTEATAADIRASLTQLRRVYLLSWIITGTLIWLL